jgi:hypothetical protein
MQFVHRPSGRLLARLGLTVLLAFAVLTIAHQGVAFGQTVVDPDYWKQTAERQATVERFVYGQSPQAIPASYDPVREAEQILAQEQRALPASSPEVRTLWTQIRNLTVEEGLSTAPRAMGTIGLAVGVFEIGWKIGSGLNAKFLKIGVPEAIPHTNTDFRGNGFGQDLVWHAAGFRAEGGGKVIQPVDGFTWTRIVDGGYRYSYWKTGTPDSGCDMNRVAPPAELVIETATIAGKDCGYGEDRASTDYHVAYVPDEQLGAPGPIEPYTNQPYSKSSSAPTPPAQTTVQQGIEDALDNPENGVLRDWVNYKLGSPGQTDPTGLGPANAAIEFPDWFDKWQKHGQEFENPYADPVEYRRDATEIVERGDRGDEGFIKCNRVDGATIYWDPDRRAIVIVKDGKIDNYFPPLPTEDAFDYFLQQCTG